MVLFNCQLCGYMCDDGDIPNRVCMSCDDVIRARDIKGGVYFIRDNREHTFLSVQSNEPEKALKLKFVTDPTRASLFTSYDEAAVIMRMLPALYRWTKINFCTIEFLAEIVKYDYSK